MGICCPLSICNTVVHEVWVGFDMMTPVKKRVGVDSMSECSNVWEFGCFFAVNRRLV